MGADADTLGAITGSIAEALWGIPEWIKVKADIIKDITTSTNNPILLTIEY